MRHFLRTLAPACLVLAGCGDSLPPETDPVKGREVLKTVLSAWTVGQSMHDLGRQSPPITAYDPDWEAGRKLIMFELDPTDRRAGVDLLVKVKLTLEGKDGKPETKTVNFAVAIGAQTVVTRKQ